MPLRRWMHEHDHPGWYSWVVVVMAPILASMAVLNISLKVNERSIERERSAREASTRAFCSIIILLDDSWHDTPPPSQSGKALALAVSNARAVNHCPTHQGD